MQNHPEIIPYGHMMQDYLVARIRELSDARLHKLAGIKTRSQAEALVRNVRLRVQRCFGPLPEKTPLRARVTGALERDGYRIEKVIFESRPDFPVTANLYIPTQTGAKLPGVIGACGHSGEGKAADNYQAFCQGLTRLGFVVLIYDPLGQGERRQLADLTYSGFVSGPCSEHNMLGNVMQLCGDFMGTWRAWDGIRALDYLLTRPEIDPACIGVTGNSGGGTLTCYLSALDARYTMAAPSCFVTSYRRNVENELPQDSEQNPPGFLAAGLEMADFFIAHAPRPTLLLGQENDFFDRRGLIETWREIRRIYRLLGADRKIEYFIGPDDHGFWQPNREAMYRFFCRQAGLRPPAAEPDVVLESQTDLQCTGKGQVVAEKRKCRRVFDFTAATAQALRRQRSRTAESETASSLSRLLAVKPSRSVPEFRVLRSWSEPEMKPVLSRFAIESEPGITPVLFREGEGTCFQLAGSGPAQLWVTHLGTRQDWRAGLIAPSGPEVVRFAIDPRGRGESRPLTCSLDEDFDSPYGSDFLCASCGSMLDEPYAGGPVRDVLAAVNLLIDRGFEEIRLSGRGLGALTAVFAAILAGERIASVRLLNPLLSYHELTQAPFYRWPFSSLVPCILKELDLPDLYRALGKRLELHDPWNADMEPWKETEARAQARKLGIAERVLRCGEWETLR